MKTFSVKFTKKQVEAVQAALPDTGEDFSEKIRRLVAGGLALYQIEWPPTPAHGGRRAGAGRKRKEANDGSIRTT